MAVMKLAEPATILAGVGGIVNTIGPTVSEWIESGYLPTVTNAKFIDADISTG